VRVACPFCLSGVDESQSVERGQQFLCGTRELGRSNEFDPGRVCLIARMRALVTRLTPLRIAITADRRSGRPVSTPADVLMTLLQDVSVLAGDSQVFLLSLLPGADDSREGKVVDVADL